MQANCSLFSRYGGRVVIGATLFSDPGGKAGSGSYVHSAGERTTEKGGRK